MRYLGYLLVAVLTIGFWTTDARAACRWEWDCSSGQCRQAQVCDNTLDIPAIRTPGIPPISTDADANALALMRSADELSGVHPGMTHAEIRRVFDTMTKESLTAAYLIREYKKTIDGGARADLVARMVALAAESPAVAAQINQALAGRISIVRRRRVGRPRKHASDEARRREASRAYRERRKAGQNGSETPAPPA